MTISRDEILRMALEAGFGPAAGWPEAYPPFERFAHLVAAHARHTPGVLHIAREALAQEEQRGYRRGVKAEREACAHAVRLADNGTEAAAIIRARGP